MTGMVNVTVNPAPNYILISLIKAIMTEISRVIINAIKTGVTDIRAVMVNIMRPVSASLLRVKIPCSFQAGIADGQILMMAEILKIENFQIQRAVIINAVVTQVLGGMIRIKATNKLFHKMLGSINTSETGANFHEVVSATHACEMLNVSERSVKTAKKVEQNGSPALIEQVESRHISVSAAADVAGLPEENRL